MNRWSKELVKHKKMMRERRSLPLTFTPAKSLPKLDTANKRGSAALSLPSGPMVGGVCARQSMTDEMTLRHESPEVRAAILAKADRLAPLYNKGPIQYVTPDQRPSRGKSS